MGWHLSKDGSEGRSLQILGKAIEAADTTNKLPEAGRPEEEKGGLLAT